MIALDYLFDINQQYRIRRTLTACTVHPQNKHYFLVFGKAILYSFFLHSITFADLSITCRIWLFMQPPRSASPSNKYYFVRFDGVVKQMASFIASPQQLDFAKAPDNSALDGKLTATLQQRLIAALRPSNLTVASVFRFYHRAFDLEYFAKNKALCISNVAFRVRLLLRH